MKVLFNPLPWLLVVFLCHCGPGKTGDDQTIEPGDTAAINRIARGYYQTMLDRDTVKMHGFFAPDIDEYVDDLVEVMEDRKNNWGKMESYRITASEARFDPTAENAKRVFIVVLSARYAYNQSEDILEIGISEEGSYALINYVLDDMLVFDCSAERMKTLRPVFQEMVENLVNRKDEKIKKWFEPDSVFFRESMSIRDEFFPTELVDHPAISYHNGYLRQDCGSKKGNNGFVSYKVVMNDTAVRYVTFVFSTYDDNPTIDMYKFMANYDDGYDLEEDQALTKRLSREIFRLLEKRDHLGFFHALHPDAQFKTDGSDFNEEEIKEMVEYNAALGKFIGFYQVTTLSLTVDEEQYLRYVTIVHLRNEEDEDVYVELSFKPDAKDGKIKLMGFEEM